MFDYVYDWVPNAKQQVVTSPTKNGGVAPTSPTPREDLATSAKPTPPRSPVTMDTRHIASVSTAYFHHRFFSVALHVKADVMSWFYRTLCAGLS